MRILILFSALFLSSCVSNNTLMSSSNATINVTRMHQLELGMTREEVYQIMRYPSREDQFTTDEGCYDVWFYVTKSTVFGQSEEVPRNLTPIVFKEGIVIGVGYEYYNWLVKKSKTPAPPPPKTKERENFEFERSLAPSSSTPTAPEPKKSKPLSMNKAPKQSKPAEADKKKEEVEKKNKQDEEDLELLHEEEEQNFNEW